MKAMQRFVCFLSLLLTFASAGFCEDVRYNVTPRGTVEARLGRYEGNDRERKATLMDMFKEAGCHEPHLSEQPVKRSKLPNVICELPGDSEKTIIVGAHFDHSAAGDGVVDNWSGASLLPSVYEAVKGPPRNHRFLFIGFTDEERGAIGSNFYVKQMTKEQVAGAVAMVNLDTLGLAPSKVWTSHSDRRLTNALVYIAGLLKLPLAGVDVEQVGTSDSESFAARRIPRITIHSLTQETYEAGFLHSRKDKLSAVKLDDYYQTYRLLAAYLAFLDQALLRPGENDSGENDSVQ